MPFAVYRSTDASAPQLAAGVNTFGNILNACLVTGYGAKSAAGWTRPYTSTGIQVFRQGTGGQNRCIRVHNTSATSGPSGAHEAFVRGYESMTAHSTGTNPFPTVAQISANGMLCPTFIDGGSETPKWIIRANETWFDMFWNPGHGTTSGFDYTYWLSFGNFQSTKSGDVYNQMIYAPNVVYWQYNGVGTTNNLFLCRNDQGVAGAVTADFVTMNPGVNEAEIGAGTADILYPNRPNSSLYLFQYIMKSEKYFRGTVPGVWGTPSGIAGLGNTGDTIQGAGNLAGKTFELVKSYPSSTGHIIETSNTFTAAI